MVYFIDITEIGNLLGIVLGSSFVTGWGMHKYHKQSAAAEAKQKENEARSIEMQVTEKIQQVYDKALDDMRTEFEKRMEIQQQTIDRLSGVIGRQDEKLLAQDVRIAERDKLIISLRSEIERNNNKIQIMQPNICFRADCKDRCQEYSQTKKKK